MTCTTIHSNIRSKGLLKILFLTPANVESWRGFSVKGSGSSNAYVIEWSVESFRDALLTYVYGDENGKEVVDGDALTA